VLGFFVALLHLTLRILQFTPGLVRGLEVPALPFRAPSVFVAASATRSSVENGCGGRADGFLAASPAFSWLKERSERSTVWTGISLPAIQPASATLSMQFVTHIWYVFSISLRARLPGSSSNSGSSAAKSGLAFAGPTRGWAVGLCWAVEGALALQSREVRTSSTRFPATSLPSPLEEGIIFVEE